MSMNLMPGFQFDPTDEELINFFLWRKIHGVPTPAVYPRMPDANVYGKKGDHPSQIFDSFGESDREEEDTVRYFFTRLVPVSKKKGCNGKNVVRSVGSGDDFWRNERSESVKVKNKDGGQDIKIGSRTYLKFIDQTGVANPDRVEWSMRELMSTDDNALVLCRIEKKIPKSTTKKRKQAISSTTNSTSIVDNNVDEDLLQENKRQCLVHLQLQQSTDQEQQTKEMIDNDNSDLWLKQMIDDYLQKKFTNISKQSRKRKKYCYFFFGG
ncbi:NAC domain-containing protein 41-like [Spinacia oleracea]|uniref:NAC domain-containing protein 41-like n=1 Tax=Spinacia oleracea TaxID=3562 RepID=A0ABM3RGN1_SPIOL|nr:NAC domain-containing protein 41-like [Spinacia oleracea]